jgi:hypothetical protein
LSIKDPGMSLDMRLLAVSDERAGSKSSELVAVGVSEPLVTVMATDSSDSTAYVTPLSGGPSCRLLAAACSPVICNALAGRGVSREAGPGRRFAGSNNSPDITNALALRLSTCKPDGCCDALKSPPVAMLRLTADKHWLLISTRRENHS